MATTATATATPAMGSLTRTRRRLRPLTDPTRLGTLSGQTHDR
jgi:hypothetical protein